MVRSKQQSKRGGVLSPVVWFLIGWGVVVGLLLLIIIVQDVDLSSQLTASAPSGSPTGSVQPHSCYHEDGCAKAAAGHTAKSCDRLRGGENHVYYFIRGKQCLEEYEFKANVVTGQACTGYGKYDQIKEDCVSDLFASIDGKPCPAGKAKVWWGTPELAYARKYHPEALLGLPSINAVCDATCTAVYQCKVSYTPSPQANVYVSIDNANPVVEGAGLSKSYFHLQVHDKNKNNVSNHGGVVVKYHTEESGGIWGDAALEGEDYERVNTSVTIPNGTDRQTVSVKILDDDDPENKEAFEVKLDSVTGGQMAIQTGYGVIIDNDFSSVTPTP